MRSARILTIERIPNEPCIAPQTLIAWVRVRPESGTEERPKPLLRKKYITGETWAISSVWKIQI